MLRSMIPIELLIQSITIVTPILAGLLYFERRVSKLEQRVSDMLERCQACQFGVGNLPQKSMFTFGD